MQIYANICKYQTLFPSFQHVYTYNIVYNVVYNILYNNLTASFLAS